jgi:hypothetical protein
MPEENTLKKHATQDFHVMVQRREPPSPPLCAIKTIICVLNHHLHLQGTPFVCMASFMRPDSHQNCEPKNFSTKKLAEKKHCIYN